MLQYKNRKYKGTHDFLQSIAWFISAIWTLS